MPRRLLLHHLAGKSAQTHISSGWEATAVWDANGRPQNNCSRKREQAGWFQEVPIDKRNIQVLHGAWSFSETRLTRLGSSSLPAMFPHIQVSARKLLRIGSKPYGRIKDCDPSNLTKVRVIQPIEWEVAEHIECWHNYQSKLAAALLMLRMYVAISNHWEQRRRKQSALIQ